MESAFEQALPGLMQQAQEANALQKQAQQQAVAQQGMENQSAGESGNPQAEMAQVEIEAQRAQTEAQSEQAKLGLQKKAQDQKFALGVMEQKSKDKDRQFKQQIEGMKLRTQQVKTFADLRMGMAKNAADMKNSAQKTQAQIARPEVR